MKLALFLTLSLATVAWAQAPSFEVASVHFSKPLPGEGQSRPAIVASRAGITIRNSSLRDCIAWAYRVRDRQVAGPDWINVERFDIIAKAAAPVATDELRSMLQTLLTDRFRLVLHRTARQLPVYALAVTRSGARLRESKADTTRMLRLPGGGLRLDFRRTSVGQLADFLSTLAVMDQPVIDASGLTGSYDFTLDLHEVAGPWSSEAERLAAPSFSTVLQEQLGLRLDSRRDALEVLLVERAERPSAN